MRVMVVWCPDWSVVAALEEADRSLRSPAAVLSANVVEVCNGPARAEGVRRGQRRRDAQARCPELVLLPANPDRDARAFEPVLAVGRGPAPRRGRPAARAARRPRPRQLVRQRDRGRGDRLPGAGRDRRVGRAGRHRRRPLHRRAGRPRGRGAGVDGRPSRRVRRRSCAACPSTCCRTTAPGVASWSGCCSDSGCAPWATSPTCRATRSSTGSAPTAPRSGDGPGARTRRCSPRAPRRPSSTRRCPSSRRSTPSRRSPSASAPPPSGSSPSSPTTSSSPPGCGSRPSPTASCARRARGCTRATSARATSSTGCTGSCSAGHGGRRLAARPQGRRRGARADRPGPVRARGRRAGGRARRGALGVGVRRPRRARGGPGAGHGRLRRRTPPGAAGRPQPVGAAGAGAVGRAGGRPAPGRPAVAGPGARARHRSGSSPLPGPPRWSTTAAARCASPTAAW